VVLAHAASVLDARRRDAQGAGWTPETLADAHAAVRLVAAVATGSGPRETVLAGTAATPEGRLRVSRRFGRQAAALTANTTARQVAKAIEGLAADASARERSRLEQLREALSALTRAQYGAAAPGASGGGIDDAVTSARDVARELARERLWSWRGWGRRPAPAAVSAPEF
jgi:hypothetical protein